MPWRPWGRCESRGACMFRQRSSGYRRRAGRARAWRLALTVVTGCGAAVLAVHLATAPRTLDAASSANVLRAHAAHGATLGGEARHGYGRGGYTMMPHVVEAAAATTMNWSGYAVTGTPGTFTSVSSSWAQPAVPCGATDTF